jgi:putative transposase
MYIELDSDLSLTMWRMRYDPERHNRRSIRLREFDYTTAGAYFVTIVGQDRACLFGDVIDGEMHLNDAGRMVETVWTEIPAFYPGVDIDSFVIMPNHLHGIVVLEQSSVGVDPRVDPGSGRSVAGGQT